MPTPTLNMNPLAPNSVTALTAETSGHSSEVSTFVYDACYYLSYGLVYPIVWLGFLVPRENPIVFGFRDGAKAALDELNSRN
jgi:hypothetical protein